MGITKQFNGKEYEGSQTRDVHKEWKHEVHSVLHLFANGM